MSQGEQPAGEGTGNYDIEDVLEQLRVLERTVTTPEEQREVERAKRMIKRVPGSDRIRKYTTRDISEGIVGGIVFSLPLLVEDGVFEIAEWFLEFTVGPLPIFLAVNSIFVVALATGLLYATDFRDVRITSPIFGVVPRRLLGVLVISFTVAAVMMFIWGRLHEEDPTALERLARITVLWAAAALGSTLGDILPGESSGTDISDLIADIGDGSESKE